MGKSSLSDSELEELWSSFFAAHEEGQRDSIKNRIAAEYVDLVQVLARKIHKKLPSSVEYGDLISDGYFGLLDAIDKFDPARGYKFETYASSRISGEITDKLRDYDWVSRYFRLKFKEVSQTRDALLQELQREPTSSEVADRLGWPLSEVDRMQAGFNSSFHVNIDERMRDSTHEYFKLSELIADQTAGEIGFDVENEELIQRVIAALEKLKPNESLVLYMYLYEGRSYAEISEELGTTTGRVSQILDSALKNMRRKLVGW